MSSYMTETLKKAQEPTFYNSRVDNQVRAHHKALDIQVEFVFKENRSVSQIKNALLSIFRGLDILGKWLAIYINREKCCFRKFPLGTHCCR